MKFGDIVLRKDEASGEEYLEWSTERESKTRHGDENEYKTLLDSGVSHNNVAPLSGHKSLKSLDSYAVASHQQQRQMSKILSGKENSRPKPKAETGEEKPQNQSSGTVHEPIQTNGIFSGASIGVINIQNLVLPEASG